MDKEIDVDNDVSLDSTHVEVLLKAVEKTGPKSDTCIRIFERNEFYYFFEKDGELAAKYIFGSVTAMKSMGKKKPANFCVMNHANFESLLKYVLLVKHFKVEIFKFVASKGGNPATFKLEVRASPGNVAAIEHILYGEGESTNRDNNFLVGLKVNPSLVDGQISLGLAAIDAAFNLVRISDFLDTNSFQSLESVLVQLSPREVILPQSENAIIKKIAALVTKHRILVTEKPSKEFGSLSEAEIKRLFVSKTNFELFKSESLSSGALNSLIQYLNFDAGMSAKFSLELLSCTNFMRLSSRAINGLNVFPSPLNSSSYSSLLGILNHTRTAGGSRLLQQWLKQPLLDPVMINERLDLVQVMVNSTEMRQMLHEDLLRKFPDFQRLSAKFGSAKVSLQDMYKVYVALSHLLSLVSCLQDFAGEGDCYAILQDNFIKDLQGAHKDFEKFYQMVESTMDMEQVEEGHFMIKPEFDDNLKELRDELDSIESKIKNQEVKASSELGVEKGKVLKLEYSSQHGYYFRLTMKEEKIVRGNKNYSVIEANKSGIKFRNTKLETLNENHADLTKKYEEQQRSIVNEMVGIASGYTEPMTHLGHVISQLDVIVSLAIAAVSAPSQFVRPKVLPKDSKGSKINLKQLRHPIVELQDNVNFIPNDVEFSASSTFHIITGPNMGGKSTFLRSVGVAVLLAQCGSFVPAEEAELTVVDSILVRIGASDCQVDGVSTFMAEMVETQSILASASESSLVLIDELGRGTSTYDGFGIAWAVSNHIARVIKCPTLFTTHYTELTELSHHVDTVSNFHVSALVHEDKLTLLYQLQPGICDQSFGIDVAKIANFPKEVIENAQTRIANLEGLEFTKNGSYTGEERQRIVIEGNNILSDYLDKIKTLGDIKDDQELLQKFKQVKSELASTNNDFIKSLLVM